MYAYLSLRPVFYVFFKGFLCPCMFDVLCFLARDGASVRHNLITLFKNIIIKCSSDYKFVSYFICFRF